MQREEPKCRCNSISTAVGDRHVVTTVPIKMTSGFSTCSINALRSLPSQHLQDSRCPSNFYLHCFHQLLKSVAQGDLFLCTNEHLSCTMSSLDNHEIKGWNSSSLIPGFGKVWRDIYTSVSAPMKNCWSLKDTCLQNQNSDKVHSKEKMASYGILITA